MQRVAPLIAALILAAGCAGGDDEPAAEAISVADAADVTGAAVVEGFLHIAAVPREQPRVCASLSDSHPPQCRRPALRISKLPSTLPQLEATPDGMYLWSARPVHVRGTLRDGVLHARAIED